MKFLYGEEGFLIDQELNRLLKQSERDVILYSSNESIEDILIDASTNSMFSDNKKLLVIKNHDMFNDDSFIDEFIDNISANDSTDFIFILETGKINKSKKLIKFLLSKADVSEFKSITSKDTMQTIRDIIETRGATIENKALISLSTKLPTDLRIIFNEVEKLLHESKNITYEMVETSIDKYFKDDFFALSNAITSGDTHGIVSSYRNQRLNGSGQSVIIAQISSILSLSLLVGSYIGKGYSNDDISNELNIHAFRVKKARELINGTDIENIKSLIKTLADLDKDIKTGQIDPHHGLEVYLLKLIQ